MARTYSTKGIITYNISVGTYTASDNTLGGRGSVQANSDIQGNHKGSWLLSCIEELNKDKSRFEPDTVIRMM